MYRGKYTDVQTAGSDYAKEIKQIVERQEKCSDQVAAFIHESLLSCAGQIVLPDGYLKDAYKYVITMVYGVCVCDGSGAEEG